MSKARGYVVVWLCGSVVVWLCSCMVVWLCSYVVVWVVCIAGVRETPTWKTSCGPDRTERGNFNVNMGVRLTLKIHHTRPRFFQHEIHHGLDHFFSVLPGR